MIGLLISILISLAFAYLLGYMAQRRGASFTFWAVMGAVLGPLAIPFLLLAKSKKR
jgi:hypothetical protein